MGSEGSQLLAERLNLLRRLAINAVAHEPRVILRLQQQIGSMTMGFPWHADGSPETNMEGSSAAGGGPSEEGPSSVRSVSTEAQGSEHLDGDDEATSLPHVPSDESIAAAERAEMATVESPSAAAARKVCVSMLSGCAGLDQPGLRFKVQSKAAGHAVWRTSSRMLNSRMQSSTKTRFISGEIASRGPNFCASSLAEH